LTEAKFIANPFTGSASDRCYRTGDLGTYLADGSASFLGRGDSQVKIRGHRIELAEIENAITRQPHIGQCVVVANQDGGATRLVAYCVAQQATRADELRQALAGQLPDYMVPALFVFLDALPLTPNGKVDKRALPAFDDSANQALSPLAEKLSTAWARILQVPRLDARLSFVELGGDSISFVQASRVLEALIGHLPERWETLPVCQLAELSAPPKGAWRVMEMPVFVRMLAIILIVVGHLSEFDHWLIVGETSVLFLVPASAWHAFSSRPSKHVVMHAAQVVGSHRGADAVVHSTDPAGVRPVALAIAAAGVQLVPGQRGQPVQLLVHRSAGADDRDHWPAAVDQARAPGRRGRPVPLPDHLGLCAGGAGCAHQPVRIRRQCPAPPGTAALSGGDGAGHGRAPRRHHRA
jgi:hypothetical protein